MRLTHKEVTFLINSLTEFLGEYHANLRLFGSRTDDNRKGGDIDLLLLVENADVKNKLNMQKYLILARIKELLGDQKIDLKIAETTEIDTDDFLRIIYPESLSLKIWN
jgi:uncharacterized protein